jgi:hypothetical protein
MVAELVLNVRCSRADREFAKLRVCKWLFRDGVLQLLLVVEAHLSEMQPFLYLVWSSAQDAGVQEDRRDTA